MPFHTRPVLEVIEPDYTIRFDEHGHQVFHFESRKELSEIDIDDELEIEDE